MPPGVSRFDYPSIGPVVVKINNRSRSIRARWLGPELHVTIPPYLGASELDRFLDKFAQRITSLKPATRYHAAQIIDG